MELMHHSADALCTHCTLHTHALLSPSPPHTMYYFFKKSLPAALLPCAVSYAVTLSNLRVLPILLLCMAGAGGYGRAWSTRAPNQVTNTMRSCSRQALSQLSSHPRLTASTGAEQLLSIKQLHIYVLYKFVGNVCSSYSIAHNIVLHQPSISCISYNTVAAHPDDASHVSHCVVRGIKGS